MVSNKDKDFLAQMGGRIMSDNEKHENKEPSPADRIIEARVKGEEARAAIVGLGGEHGGGEGETLATSIVGKAIDKMDRATERAEEAVKRKEADAETLRGEADKARAELHGTLLTQTQNTLAEVTKALNDTRKGVGQPQTAKQVLEDALSFVDVIREKLGGGDGGKEVKVTPAQDPMVTIQLQQMAQNHEMAMKQIELQLQQMTNEFKVKMAEFQDNRVHRQREYEDNKRFREKGLEGVQDILSSIAVGISGETGEETGEVGEEAKMKATITTLPCQNCGYKIAVPAEGGHLTCPECEAEYTVEAG